MTKAEQILKLYDGKRTTREIAVLVCTSDSYVRTVARQRKGAGTSQNDRRYLQSSLGVTVKRSREQRRWATNVNYRLRHYELRRLRQEKQREARCAP